MSEKDLETMMAKQNELMKGNFALIQREIDQGKEAMTEVRPANVLLESLFHLQFCPTGVIWGIMGIIA